MAKAQKLVGTTHNDYLTDGTITGLSVSYKSGLVLTLSATGGADTPTCKLYFTIQDDTGAESDKFEYESSANNIPCSYLIDSKVFKVYPYIVNAGGCTITALLTRREN